MGLGFLDRRIIIVIIVLLLLELGTFWTDVPLLPTIVAFCFLLPVIIRLGVGSVSLLGKSSGLDIRCSGSWLPMLKLVDQLESLHHCFWVVFVPSCIRVLKVFA